MKLGIVGSAERGAAWEEHLRPHHSVSEITITSTLQDVGNVEACILLDKSEDRLQKVLELLKHGYHTFLVSPLPTEARMVRKVYHTAEESNVLLQFSHWPTLVPASKWMSKKINRPSFIQIKREIDHTRHMESEFDFDYYWIDELAFSLRWINGTVHHLDLQPISISEGQTQALQMFLRFESGATASIYINAAAAETSHHRIAANSHYLLDCDVQDQSVRLGEMAKGEHLYFKRHHFDASKSAELAGLEFIKSIQLNRPTIYNGHHLVELTKTIENIKKKLARV